MTVLDLPSANAIEFGEQTRGDGWGRCAEGIIYAVYTYFFNGLDCCCRSNTKCLGHIAFSEAFAQFANRYAANLHWDAEILAN